MATPGLDTAPSSAAAIQQPPAAYGTSPLSATAGADEAAPTTTSFLDLSTTIVMSQSTTSCVTSTILTVIPTVSVGYSTIQTVIPFTQSYSITSQQIVTSDVTILQTSFSVMVFTNNTAAVGADSMPTTGLPVVSASYSTPAYTGSDVVLPTTAAAGFDSESALPSGGAAFGGMASTPAYSYPASSGGLFGSSSTTPAQQMTNDAARPSFGVGMVVAALAACVGVGFF